MNNKQKNKTNNNNNKKRNKRRRIRNNPMFSSRPQTLGYGSATSIVNKRIEFADNDTDPHFINIGSAVLNQPEFVLKSQLYEYMKIQWIRVVFFPHNYVNLNSDLYIQVQYLLQPETTNVMIDDKSKIISPFQPRLKSYTFKPPNITTSNFQNTVYNFKEWLPSKVGVVNMPISLIYQKATASTNPYPCELQVKIIFRGGNVVTVSNMKNILGTFEKIIEREKNNKVVEANNKNNVEVKEKNKKEEKEENIINESIVEENNNNEFKDIMENIKIMMDKI